MHWQKTESQGLLAGLRRREILRVSRTEMAKTLEKATLLHLRRPSLKLGRVQE